MLLAVADGHGSADRDKRARNPGKKLAEDVVECSIVALGSVAEPIAVALLDADVKAGRKLAQDAVASALHAVVGAIKHHTCADDCGCALSCAVLVRPAPGKAGVAVCAGIGDSACFVAPQAGRPALALQRHGVEVRGEFAAAAARAKQQGLGEPTLVRLFDDMSYAILHRGVPKSEESLVAVATHGLKDLLEECPEGLQSRRGGTSSAIEGWGLYLGDALGRPWIQMTRSVGDGNIKRCVPVAEDCETSVVEVPVGGCVFCTSDGFADVVNLSDPLPKKSRAQTLARMGETAGRLFSGDSDDVAVAAVSL